jgi:acetylglutamate kinase
LRLEWPVLGAYEVDDTFGLTDLKASELLFTSSIPGMLSTSTDIPSTVNMDDLASYLSSVLAGEVDDGVAYFLNLAAFTSGVMVKFFLIN